MQHSILCALMSGVIVGAAYPTPAAGQAGGGAARDYPAKPIRIIVPQTAGASTDLTARLIAQKLNEAFKQPVIVDNRPGAGSIKTETAKWAKVIKAAGIRPE